MKKDKSEKISFICFLVASICFYISGIIGINNIMIATDNMEFATEIFGIEEGSNLFSYKNIIKSLTNMLRNYYNEEEINKIIKINGERFIEER